MLISRCSLITRLITRFLVFLSRDKLTRTHLWKRKLSLWMNEYSDGLYRNGKDLRRRLKSQSCKCSWKSCEMLSALKIKLHRFFNVNNQHGSLISHKSGASILMRTLHQWCLLKILENWSCFKLDLTFNEVRGSKWMTSHKSYRNIWRISVKFCRLTSQLFPWIIQNKSFIVFLFIISINYHLF